MTPSGRRVESDENDENDDSDIPDDMAEDLREEAQEEGAPVTRTATTAYEHALDTQATRTRSHSATHHDPLDVPDDDANDNPEPGAEPRERHALALDVLSDSAIDSLIGEGEKAKPKDDKAKEDAAAQAQRVMAQQTSKRDAPVSPEVLRLQKLVEQQMEAQAAAQAPTRKPRRSSSSRKDDWLKKGPSKAKVIISMGGPDTRRMGGL